MEVKQGKSPDYLNKLQELQDNMKSRIEVAGILRQLRLANIRNKFEAEEQVSSFEDHRKPYVLYFVE